MFIFNTDGKPPWLDHSIGDLFWETVCVQSVGAAIQNICLAAHALGLGSLWICDVFYAYEELAQWLGQDTQMVAAVSLGYPAESPVIFSRKPLADVMVWF